MALTIEIDHAKTRGKAAAAAGQPVVPQARQRSGASDQVGDPALDVVDLLRSSAGTVAPERRTGPSFSISQTDGSTLSSSRSLFGHRTPVSCLDHPDPDERAGAPAVVRLRLSADRLDRPFLIVERLIEGDRRQRLKNFGVSLTAKRAAQIAAKHSSWLLISLATGGTLIFYFTDAPDLLRSFASGDVSANALTCIAVFAGTLRTGRLRTRTGLHIHVSLAAPSGRALRSGSLHCELPRLPSRAADIGEEGDRAAASGQAGGGLRRLRALRRGLSD
jgi:hypothetical protein